jgi:L-fucose mutarotase
VLEAILSVFPLDTFVDHPLERMAPENGPDADSAAQRKVLDTARAHDPRHLEFGVLSRHVFYERAKGAHAIVQTLETAPYCDFILTKGVI